MEKLKAIWDRSTSEQQKKFKLLGAGLGLIVVLYIVASMKDEKVVRKAIQETSMQGEIFAAEDQQANLEDMNAKVNLNSAELKKTTEIVQSLDGRIRQLNTNVAEVLELNTSPEKLNQVIKQQAEQSENIKKMTEHFNEQLARIKTIGGGTRTQSNEIISVPNSDEKPVVADTEEPEFDLFADVSGDEDISLVSRNFADLSGQADKATMRDVKSALVKKEEDISTTATQRTKKKLTFLGKDNTKSTPKTAGEGRKVVPKKSNTARDLHGQRVARTSGPERIVLPSNSILHGVMINGVVAPTGETAKQMPHPITIRVDADAILPNRYSFDVKECFISASGVGERSNIRVNFRTERISCIWDDKVVDQRLDAWISGTDGKTGVQGTLKSRQGQMIKNAMWAALASGFSDATKPQQLQSVKTGNNAGSVQFEPPELGDVAGLSAQNGVSGAAERIADFWQAQAESIFPVIEIDAMNEVTIHLTAPLVIHLDEDPYERKESKRTKKVTKR